MQLIIFALLEKACQPLKTESITARINRNLETSAYRQPLYRQKKNKNLAFRRNVNNTKASLRFERLEGFVSIKYPEAFFDKRPEFNFQIAQFCKKKQQSSKESCYKLEIFLESVPNSDL